VSTSVNGLCPSGVASATYTCGTVAGATSYVWTAPTGATVTSGAGTTSVTIAFDSTFTSGNITVAAQNACGTGLVKTLAVRSTLIAPTLVSTSVNGLCPSGVASATYTCGTVAGATTYNWTAPTGATITSGAGTTSVTIAFGSTFTSGNITVAAANACGPGLVKSLAVRSTLLAPTTLTGLTTGLCPSGVSSAVYTCGTVVGATTYNWTVPTGATITAGAGTTAVTVSFASTFTTGNISVVAENACGISPAKILALRSSLLAPTTLTGPTTGICPAGITSGIYTCGAVVGASSYTWTVPTGVTITAGTGTTSITVSFASTFTTGNISVQAVNACGISLAKILAVRSSLLAPGVITGSTVVCASSTSNNYSILPVVGATSYVWTVPTGSTITSGAGTSAIVVDFGTAVTGGITVKAVNACGSGLARALTLSMTCMGTYSNESKSITNVTSESTVELFPNPTSDNLNINFVTEFDKDVVVEIFNSLGSKISSVKYSLTSGENSIITNVSEFNNGLYFVKIADLLTNEVLSKTFIKQ
ncbi:MAG: T9SS type A sorting domain-containing protein, partial [Bacteroidetes bacterium]|nr:T9SS type A sorting domain-containing protein [Bacteroidota bacterium]